jgi:hypothetical protein
MAVIEFTQQKNLVHTDNITWASVTGSDTGAPREYAKFNDKTVQVFGTFGDTLTIQGSNDGTNWATLSDSTGVPLEFTAAGIKLIAECPRYIRPSAGASITSVTVIIQATRS